MRLQAIARVLPGRALPGLIVLAALAMSTPAMAQTSASKVLAPAETAKLLPAAVYYDGQSAPTQLRNSGGVKFADGHFVLTTLVDTSGYSTGIAAKYQGYLIAEVPVKIEGKSLTAGAYGIGFLDGGRFLVTDLGGHDALAVHATRDQALQRPRPLQVTADPAGGFRLYAGRSYVRFDR